MLRAVILSVVSSAAQAEEDRYSLPEQVRMNTEAAARLGATVVATLAFQHSRWFSNVAALTSESPDYARLIELIRSRMVDLLILTQMDRLGRTARLQLEMQDFCWENGVQLYAVAEPLGHPIDPELFRRIGPTSGERQARSYQAIGAESYVRMFVQNSLRGKRGRAMAGLHPCSNNPPYGYTFPEPRIPKSPLVIHPREAEGVILAGEMRAQFAGYAKIGAALTERGIATRSGAPWQVPVIHGIVTNAWYAGFVVYREYSRQRGSRSQRRVSTLLFPGQHAPLWSAELWEKIKVANTAMTNKGFAGTAKHPEYWLGGIARCAHCGNTMAYYRRDTTNRPLAMRCGVNLRGGGCVSNSISAYRVHDAVAETLRSVVLHPDILEAEIAARHADSQADAASTLAHLNAAMEETVKRERAILDAIESGAFALDALVARQERVLADRARITQDMDALREEMGADQHRRDSVAALANAAALLTEDHPDSLALAARTLIRAVFIDRTGPTVTIEWR